jgi:hypothetical protein
LLSFSLETPVTNNALILHRVLQEPLMSKRDDERTKLSANLLNGIAVACVVTGLITPFVAVFFNFGNSATDIPAWKLIMSTMAFGACAFVLHKIARRILESHSE